MSSKITHLAKWDFHFLALLVFFVLLSNFAAASRAEPGSLDSTFDPGTAANKIVNAIALQPDGKILLGGDFTTINSTNRKYVARLNPDGSLDGSFDPGDGPDNNVFALALQPDGKVIVGGGFGLVDQTQRYGVARLRTDGSLDLSFDPGAWALYPAVLSVALQSNGQVLAGGNFTYATNLLRLNTNGNLDRTFNAGIFLNGNNGALVQCLAVQTNGEVFVGGGFTSINGVSRNYVALLNSNGAVDNSFQPDPIVGSLVDSIVLQTNGQILIGGSFSTINGYTRHNIARLNADGTLDLSFKPAINSSPGNTYQIYSMALQPDGKLLAGCAPQTVDGVNNVFLIRLNKDGSLDTNFGPVVTAPGQSTFSISAIAIQPDGKVLVGGSFTSINGVSMNNIARLNGDSVSTTNFQFLAADLYSNQCFGAFLEGAVSNTYRIEWTSDLNRTSIWVPLFDVTLQTNPQFILDPSPISARRFYRAVLLSP